MAVVLIYKGAIILGIFSINLKQMISTSIIGLVVEFIVAIDEACVRFTDDALLFLFLLVFLDLSPPVVYIYRFRVLQIAGGLLFFPIVDMGCTDMFFTSWHRINTYLGPDGTTWHDPAQDII